MAKTSIDMTSGEPWKLLVKFAIPTMLGGLLNQVYSITDSIIVAYAGGKYRRSIICLFRAELWGCQQAFANVHSSARKGENSLWFLLKVII